MTLLPQASPPRLQGSWAAWLLPLSGLLALGAALISIRLPQALQSDLPAEEIVSLQQIEARPDGLRAFVVNAGPQSVTIAQVMVDDAFWSFQMDPGTTVPRLGRAVLSIPYPWVHGEPHRLVVLTSTGLTFEGELPVAVPTPPPGVSQLLAYALVGGFVGVVPVGLGLLFYPAMRRMGRQRLNAILALTVGMLVFLLIDTSQEALEIAGALPEVFQGQAVVLLIALLSWLAIGAIGNLRREAGSSIPTGEHVAWLLAAGIGLHNLGEGMAIGAAFALGEAALGSFLILGFTLHNITEGIGIAAPLTPGRKDLPEGYRPRRITFVGLTLVAGVPAVFGAWIGGFAYNPLAAAAALGVGMGAIWQVILEVGRLLRDDAARHEETVLSGSNVLGFVLGAGIMYTTALLVTV